MHSYRVSSVCSSSIFTRTDRQTDIRTPPKATSALLSIAGTEVTINDHGRPSVCLSVVCNVRAPYTQAIEIFGNVSTPCGTLAIHDLCIKILRRSSPAREPLRRGLNPRGVAIWDLSKAISTKRCKIWYKLALITNRKSHMSFRLVPNSVTLNSPNDCVISSNSVAFWADYIKVVKDTPTLSEAEM